jgi:U3 small nucleolar ribonucleoprotein protein LCP5
MAVDNSLESLLATLVSSIHSAIEALPTEDILPPKEGISLLDVKNDLLLSYLQNLVFLIVLKLRAHSSAGARQDFNLHPHDEVVQKLVELRVYLEKGVRPLENRLKYNIDKIIRTADDAARKLTRPAIKAKPKKSREHAGAESDVSEVESDGSAQTEEDEDEMTYGPRGTAMARTKADVSQEKAKESAKDGIYRPPKITPMAMPTTEGREAKRERRPGKSSTLDEFIATELSSAPMEVPSPTEVVTQNLRRSDERRMREENTKRQTSRVLRLSARKSKPRGGVEGKTAVLAEKNGEVWVLVLTV